MLLLCFMQDFDTSTPCFGILKHNNACGFATRDNLLEAYKAALAADPISAFGGILIQIKKLTYLLHKKLINSFVKSLLLLHLMIQHCHF